MKKRIELCRWSDGGVTLFIQVFRYIIAVGGFAGNGFPGIHLKMDSPQLLVVTIRSGGYHHYETSIYVRMGQELYKRYPNPEKYKAWCIDGDSQHFILLAGWLASFRLLNWFHVASYEEGEPHDSGHYFATGKFLWINHSTMF